MKLFSPALGPLSLPSLSWLFPLVVDHCVVNRNIFVDQLLVQNKKSNKNNNNGGQMPNAKWPKSLNKLPIFWCLFPRAVYAGLLVLKNCPPRLPWGPRLVFALSLLTLYWVFVMFPHFFLPSSQRQYSAWRSHKTGGVCINLQTKD